MVNQVVEYIITLTQSMSKPLKKDEIAKAVAKRFQLKKSRSVYWSDHFAIRFSSARTQTFSNTVLGLSTLKNYDYLPFIVCVVRNDECEFLLANSTFLKKISHSSHQLALDNIKGSFLGHDIMRLYGEYTNSPENFDVLFQIHQETPWVDNLQRLVDTTNEIQGVGQKFLPSSRQRNNIFQSVLLVQQAQSVLSDIKIDIDKGIIERRNDILKLAQIDNVNERGNLIEQIITKDINRHEIGDLYFRRGKIDIILDVKTKILGKSSNPKGYNIDKLLETLAQGNIFFGYYFLGINRESSQIKTVALSFLDSTIIDCTRIQFHWAGRNSRGVTQLSSGLDAIFLPRFMPEVEENKAIEFLEGLIAL